MPYELPARFTKATFASYKPQTPSQAESLEEASRFVEDLKGIRKVKRTIARIRKTAPLPYKGVYLVGPVGTGKTHLLSAIFNALHPAVPCAFITASAFFRTTDTPDAFARKIASRYRVLCMDEIELDDPANEVRLVRTLKALDRASVMVVATSNVEPDKFLATAYGGDRFRRFLSEEFRRQYRVILVRGDDFRKRLPKLGYAWIGPSDETLPLLQSQRSKEAKPHRSFTFPELLRATVDLPHPVLMADLRQAEALYISGIEIQDTDQALRLLRVIDEIYLLPAPPTLYFTAETPPDRWFTPEQLHGILEKGIAEKFLRTVSRLQAMCHIQHIELLQAA